MKNFISHAIDVVQWRFAAAFCRAPPCARPKWDLRNERLASVGEKKSRAILGHKRKHEQHKVSERDIVSGFRVDERMREGSATSWCLARGEKGEARGVRKNAF